MIFSKNVFLSFSCIKTPFFFYFLHFYADQILLHFKPPPLPTVCQVIVPGCIQFLVPCVSVSWYYWGFLSLQFECYDSCMFSILYSLTICNSEFGYLYIAAACSKVQKYIFLLIFIDPSLWMYPLLSHLWIMLVIVYLIACV